MSKQSPLERIAHAAISIIIATCAAGAIMFAPPRTSDAARTDSEAIIRELRAVLHDALPPNSEVLPGYTRLTDRVPTLVVADFQSQTEDHLAWGSALGRLLRRKLTLPSGFQLRTPDANVFRQDAWSHGMPDKEVGRSLESLRLIARRLGIEYGITGTIEVTEPLFALTIELRRLPSGEVIRALRFSGAVETLPETLGKAAVEVCQAVGVTLDTRSASHLSRPMQENYQQIKDFAKVLSEIRGKAWEEAFLIVKRLWDKEPSSSALAALYMYHIRKPDKYFRAYLNELDQVAHAFPGDVGLKLSVAYFMGYRDSTDLLEEKIRRLQEIVRERPEDPTAMIMLTDVLASNGRALPSLIVAMETLERWPDHYRAWWNMSYAVLEYAWQLRGEAYWVDVSEEGKRLFPPLKDIADKAVNVALDLNPDMVRLWILKMRTIAGYGPELMESFHKAMRLAPHYRDVYATALNFSLPQWGGSYEAQDEIWQYAVKNNPDAEWLQEVRNKFVKEPPPGYKMKKPRRTLDAWLVCSSINN